MYAEFDRCLEKLRTAKLDLKDLLEEKKMNHEQEFVALKLVLQEKAWTSQSEGK